MLKKLLSGFFILFVTGSAFSQAITVNSLPPSGHFDPTPPIGCNLGNPIVTCTYISSTGSHVSGNTLVITDPCGKTTVHITISNVRWTKNPNSNWLHGLFFPSSGGLSNIVPGPLPAGWRFFNYAVTGAPCSSQATGPAVGGFYFDGATGASCCTNTNLDNNPANNFGDILAGCGVDYGFGFDMDICNNILTASYIFKMRGVADYATGCWSGADFGESAVVFKLDVTPSTITVFSPTPTGSLTRDCSSGSPNFYATYIGGCGDPAYTVSWWDAPTGGTQVGSGSPFVYNFGSTCPGPKTLYAQCCPVVAGNTCNNRRAVTSGACPPTLAITAINKTDGSCTTPSQINSVTVTGGSGTITYTLNPGAISNTTGIFTGLTGTSYTLTVSDASGCSVSVPVTFTPSSTAAFTETHSTTPASCPGANDGSITVNVNPVAIYTYVLDGNAATSVTNNTGTITFNGVSGGAHFVTITDGSTPPCTLTANMNVAPGTAIPAPTATSPVNYCQNAAAVPLTATGTGLLWYTVSTGGTGSTTAPTPSTLTVGSTTYYVSQSAPPCESARTPIVVNVTATPAAPGVTSPVTYCQNATATPLTATGTNLLWYTVSSGGTGSSTAPTPLTTATGSTIYYVSQTTGTCEGPRAAITVDVTAQPAAPAVTSPVTYCQNATATPLTATGTGLLWYTASSGGTGSSTAPTPITTAAGSTIYYVSQTVSGCESPRASITVDITATPAAPTVTSPVAYCQNATAIPLTATGTGLLWYTVSSGGTGSSTAPTPSTTAGGSTIYYVSQTVSGCESPRVSITVDVTATPAAPAVTSPVIYCQNAPATPLTAAGTNLLWYTVSSGGTGSTTAPTPVTTAAGSTIYYVSQSTGTCEGPRASITVDVTASLAAPTVTSPVTYCQNATATPLTATGTGLLWYTASSGGTGSSTAPTPITTAAGSTIYYVSQTSGTCESPRASITVDVTATPAAPAVTSPVAYCQSATATPLTATGTGLLWYTVSSGGTGSSTAPTPSTTAGGSTIYYVSQTVSGCESPRASITVDVTATPVAPTVTSPVTYCQNATATALTATGTNLLWYTVSSGGTGSATAPTPVTTTAGSTIYYVSQTTGTCEGPRAAITVDVTATPAAPTVTSPVAYCQSATATPLTATGTGLLWYTTSSGGTGSATAPTPSTAAGGSTIYYVSQTVSGCEGPRAAITVDVTATPAAPAVASPVDYCQGATATVLSATGTNLLWYTVSSGGTGSTTAPIPSTATGGTTIYYVSQTTGTCEGPRAAITVNVTATPVAPTVTSPVTYCQGITATALTATGTNLLWYTVSSGGTGSATAPTPSTSAVGSTIYYVSQSTGTCEGPRASITVDINATPAAPAVTSPVTYCQNATATPLTATGTNLLWYTVSSGGTGSATAPTPVTTAAGSTIYYVSQTTGICEGPRAAITVDINATPAAPAVTSPVTYCQNATATPLTATGTNLLWYTVSSGGTGSATAPTPVTTAAGSTIYYVSQSTGTCEGPRSSIIVDVTATPAAPTVTTPVTYCQGITATALTATGTNLLWYTVSSGGTGSATAPIPSTAAVGSTIYYVSQSTGTCEGLRAAITVDVNITPAAPTVTSPVTYCQNVTPTALTATGTNLLWYTTSSGGTGSTTAPTPVTTAVGSTTYYVSQTTGTCEGPRAAITVDINPTPALPGVTSPVEYCEGATATALTATGTNLLWYTVSSGGTGSATAPTPSTATAGSTTYYVSQTALGCEGPREAITVNVTAIPAAPAVTTPVTYCQNTTAATLTATGTNLLWYTTSSGGTGSATAPTPSTATSGSTTYYVSQSNGTCEGPRAAITINITATPAAPGVTATFIYCEGAPAATLTATGTNILWYTTATGGTGSTTAPTPSTVAGGTTTYYVTQTVSGCESPRATIDVMVVATPAAPTVVSPVNYCPGDAATPLTATGTNLLWYNSAVGGTATSTAPTPSTAVSGSITSYYVSQTTTAGSCEGPRAEIVVNVSNPLVINLGPDVTICQGDTAVLTPTVTPAATSYVWSAVGGDNSTILDVNSLNTKVFPVDTTQYILKATLGGCTAQNTIWVNVRWRPIIEAGANAAICLGDSTLLVGSVSHLSAGSGFITSYAWTPTDSLTTPGAISTWAHPATSTWYKLTATTTIADYGCDFTSYDSVKVFIPAPVIASAGRDTIAAKGLEHQLRGSGGTQYSWWTFTPGVSINNPLSRYPTVVLNNDANFFVEVKNAVGCADTASVFVKVYEGPAYYVPNAFSPNGDGLNDIFRAIPPGMSTTIYFRVFNRYGELMFETNQYLKGWDGTYKGKPVPNGVYVWSVKGVDKNNKTVEKQGTVTVVR